MLEHQPKQIASVAMILDDENAPPAQGLGTT
jgi:hypothetical protein